MSTYAIPHRPFASEQITGLMLPDGIFEASFGRLTLNADFHNESGSLAGGATVYVEAVSDPGIVVTANTFTVGALAAGAAQRFAWPVDVSAATPGSHLVSFVVDENGVRTRILKKIFVMRTLIDPTTNEWVATVPQGVLRARFEGWLGPDARCCCGGKTAVDPPFASDRGPVSPLDFLATHTHTNDFELCLQHYLPTKITTSVTATPPFAGQYGDLPFDDPWWKVILCLIALLLLVAAAIAEAVGGSGDAGVTAGTTDPENPQDCCGVRATGGGTNYVAAGLVAAAAAVATVAAASDIRDPWRRGQDHTPVQPGQVTQSEAVDLHILYDEPVALGRPFSVGAAWKYERQTNVGSSGFGARDTNQNVHVLSRYAIHADDIVRAYKDETWVIEAEFYDADDRLMTGTELFVQCFLCGPDGRYRVFSMSDDGIGRDQSADDGVYTGAYSFARERDPRGMWTYFVIAQDVNTATDDLTPEEAAQIIGGMVRTHQLTIDFTGGTCALVPDGHVNVI